MRYLLWFAAFSLVLLGAWWLTNAGRGQSSVGGNEATSESAREAPELAEPLLEPARSEVPDVDARIAVSAPTEGVPAGSRKSRGRAPIHGQLRIAGTESVLDEVLTVRLRTGDLSLKETLETAADGSFTSKNSYSRGFVLAEVLRPAGDPAVDHEEFFDPSAEGDWIVPVPWPNFVRGRVLDRVGQELGGIELLFAQDRAAHFRAKTNKDGGFTFSGLVPGPCELSVRRGLEHHELSLTIARGPNELGDVLVPFRERAGPIRGPLRSELGRPWGTLVLTDLAFGNSCSVEPLRGASSKLAEFAFEDVPSGDYRLTFQATDGLRYRAPIRFVSPPATDIEFVAMEEGEPLEFRVHEKGKKEVEARALVLLSEFWCSLDVTCEPAEVERWIYLPVDHRPVSGGTPESRQIDVQLEEGWGKAFLFAEVGTDPSSAHDLGRPLAGVEVLADGGLVARSDADGLALLSLAQEPQTVEYRLDGWIVREDDDEGVVTFVAMTRQ